MTCDMSRVQDAPADATTLLHTVPYHLFYVEELLAIDGQSKTR